MVLEVLVKSGIGAALAFTTMIAIIFTYYYNREDATGWIHCVL